MKKYITFGKFDVKLFAIFVFIVFVNVLTILYDKFINTDKDDPYKNSRTMSVTVKHIGFSLCIIPEYIEYNSKKMRRSYKKSIANFKYKLKKYSLISLIGIIYLIHDFAYIFSDRYMLMKGKRIFLSNNFFYAFIVLLLISIIFFKDTYYKHQYISVIFIISLGILRYIIKLSQKINIDETTSESVLLEILFHVTIYTCLSVYISLSKVFMEKFYISPWQTSLLVGIINLTLNLTLYIIFSCISSEEETTFFSLKYGNNYYIDNIINFFTEYSFLKVVLYFLCHLITSMRYIIFNVILKSYTVFHIFLSYQIVSFLRDIINIFTADEYYIIFDILIIISFIIEVFASLVFLEIIELNFCDLNTNLKKNIELRAIADSQDFPISNERDLSFQIDDQYIVHFKDEENSGKKKGKDIPMEVEEEEEVEENVQDEEKEQHQEE